MPDIWPSDFEDNMEKTLTDTREHSLDAIVLQHLIQEQKAEIAMTDKQNKLMTETIIWTLEEEMKKKDAEIERLRAALGAVMDDLTILAESHRLPVGMLDDVVYVNARAALETKDE